MAGTGTAHLRPADETLLRIEDLVVEFPAGRRMKVHAVSGISLDVKKGETLGLVGESGCGKSTTGRAIMQLPRPTSGQVMFDGQDLTKLSGEDLRRMRPQLQLIFQDPISSLNPRRRVGDIVGEPLEVWKRGTAESRLKTVNEVLEAVGLDNEASRNKRPHQFSGGQCQRICIARALVLEPKVIICDEPVSALDVSVQAQILNLLEDMKQRYGLTLVFIAHDLAVVKNVSDRIAVMYLGKLCEVASPDELYTRPAHPYTAALLSAIPVADPSATMRTPSSLQGDLPSPLAPPSGCRFRTRCPRAEERCAREEPQVRPVLAGSEHYVACHFPLIEAAEVQVGPPIRLADGRTAAADAPTGSVSPNGKEWAKSSPGEGGWRSALGRMWRETSVAVKVAVLAALLPFVIHLSSTSKSGANGVVTSCTHHDYAALGGGIVAIVASIAAVATLRKAKRVPVEVAGVAIAVVIGVVQILLGLGSVGGPC